MKKQTAVEWLALYIKGITTLNCDEVIEKAKEMEKEQIKLAFGQGSLFDVVFPDQYHYRAEDYYLKHYGL